MPTDDERREVAARLREPYPRFTNLVDAFGLTAPVPIHELRYHLADLIEPEERTCRDDGTGAFRCTRCGAFARRDAVMDCTGQIPLRYCPNCGARVVDADA